MPRSEIKNVARMTVQTIGDNAPAQPGEEAPLIATDDPNTMLYDQGVDLPAPEVTYPVNDRGEQIKPPDQPQPEPVPDPDEIDDPKFKGKSRRDIHASYKELEAKLGAQSREVEETRRLANELIQRDLAGRRAPTPSNPTPADDKAEVELVSEVLSKPTQFIRRIEERILGQLGAAQAQSQIVAARNQHAQVLTDPRFVDWLVKNVPRSVAEAADRDPATLNYIVGQFNAIHAPPPAPTPTPAPARPTAPPQPAPTPMEAVRVVASAAGPMPTKDQGDRGGKIYRASEIMAQMISNPAEYERNVAEYTRAYEEGRVR